MPELLRVPVTFTGKILLVAVEPAEVVVRVPGGAKVRFATSAEQAYNLAQLLYQKVTLSGTLVWTGDTNRVRVLLAYEGVSVTRYCRHCCEPCSEVCQRCGRRRKPPPYRVEPVPADVPPLEPVRQLVLWSEEEGRT